MAKIDEMMQYYNHCREKSQVPLTVAGLRQIFNEFQDLRYEKNALLQNQQISSQIPLVAKTSEPRKFTIAHEDEIMAVNMNEDDIAGFIQRSLDCGDLNPSELDGIRFLLETDMKVSYGIRIVSK